MLIAGVAIVALPLYVAFVASTLSFDQVITVPMPMLPGTHSLDNYAQVLSHGSTQGSTAPVAPMMWNSLVMALSIAIGKIAISHALGVRHGLFPLSVAQDMLLADLRDPDAAGRGPHLSDLRGGRRNCT